MGPGLLFAVVVVGRQQGLSAGEIGALVAAFGACLLLGSFVSPLVRRLLVGRWLADGGRVPYGDDGHNRVWLRGRPGGTAATAQKPPHRMDGL